MPILSIANQKGGEGKTTTALNLSHALALKGYKTLLVDIDPQANATGIFYNPDELEFSIADLFLKKKGAEELILKTKYSNLYLLPSKIRLAEVELSPLSVEAPYILRDALMELKKYRFIVIDCPPSLSIFTVNALVSSQYVIIPLQAEKFSLDGIKGLQNTIGSIKRRINPDLRILGALMTQLKSHTVLTKTILPLIRDYFPVFQTTISQGVSIGESHLARESVIAYAPSSKQAKEYLAFTEEVLRAIEK